MPDIQTQVLETELRVVTKFCDIFQSTPSTFTAHMIMMSVDLQCSVYRIGWDVDNKEEFQTMLVLLMLVTNVDGVNGV